MKPEISIPSTNQEVLLSPENSVDRLASLGTPEISVESAVEKSAENSSRISEIDFSTVFPTPVMQPARVVSDTTLLDQPVNNNPAIASHDDIIEKEWVDRAKRIISDNSGDPYLQEKAISELQIDYIKKRYGGDVGAA